MKKYKKLVIILIVLALVVVAGIISFKVFFGKISSSEVKDQEFSKELENISEIYVNNGMAIMDENGNVRNYSDKLSLEKNIYKNVGLYDVKIKNNENDESVVTFTVKNHSNEVVEPIKFRLQFVNIDGSIVGTIDLETQKLDALGKYNVKINLNKDVLDIYNIIPTTDFENYGNIGGDSFEA